jgi:hypothetical protein
MRLVECANWPLCGSGSQLAATRVAVSRGLPPVHEYMWVSCVPNEMLVVDAGCSTPGSASSSLLDSPTLARVERARLRQEGSASAGRVGVGGTSPSHHAACCQVNQHKFVFYVMYFLRVWTKCNAADFQTVKCGCMSHWYGFLTVI